MANIFDTARYILERSGPMSAMKLQKLCYYAQAWALAWDGCPLFEEDFHVWANGPVCPELYFKTQGKYRVSAGDETGGNGDLSEVQKNTIDRVLDYYGCHDAQWLNQLALMERAWNYAGEGAREEVGREVITKESMAMYYGSLCPAKQHSRQ